MNTKPFLTYVDAERHIEFPLTRLTVIGAVLALMLFIIILCGMAGALGDDLFTEYGIQMMHGLGLRLGIALGLCLNILLTATITAMYALVSYNGWPPPEEAENTR